MINSVICGDSIEEMNKMQPNSVDLIFADPPYDLNDLSKIPTKILEHNLLKPDGIFIMEHSKKNSFKDHPSFTEERKYGNVHFSFFSKD